MIDSSFTVYTLNNNKWNPYGYLSVDNCVMFDFNGNACYRYDSGWLISFRKRDICRVDQDGRIIDIYNRVIGLIGNYSELPNNIEDSIYKENDLVFLDIISPVFKNSSDKFISDYISNLSNMEHAELIANKAYKSSPNRPEYIVLYASHLFFRMDAEAGKHGRMSETDNTTLKQLLDIYNFCNRNLNILQYSSVIQKLKDFTNYLIGEYYATHDYMVEAERVLNTVNVDEFPYKSVLMAMVISYGMDMEYKRTGQISVMWENRVQEEVTLLKRSLLSDHWFNPMQKSIALTDLQGYISGIYFGINEVEYSYYCLLFARSLQGADIIFVDNELKKYRKNHAGRLIYDIDS